MGMRLRPAPGTSEVPRLAEVRHPGVGSPSSGHPSARSDWPPCARSVSSCNFGPQKVLRRERASTLSNR